MSIDLVYATREINGIPGFGSKVIVIKRPSYPKCDMRVEIGNLVP